MVEGLPSFKAFNSVPGLYVMALGYVMLLGVVTYLVHQKAEYAEKDRAELTRLLQSCIDRNFK